MGSLPGATMKVSALSLALLPLTFGYAIFRYRLMDVDLIFKRGVVYTLAAAIVVGIVFRAGGGRGRTGAHAAAQQRSDRPDSGCGGYGAAVRSGTQVDSGPHRPVFLSHAL